MGLDRARPVPEPCRCRRARPRSRLEADSVSFLTTVVAFIIALGSLILIHELGHYLVARMLGVKVLRFSIGFGRPLVSREYGADRTQWVIAAFPLGGYVKMADEREGPVASADLP